VRPGRLLAGLLGAVLLVGLAPGQVQASPDTLRVALEDITFGAVDIVASPATGGIATARNLDEVSDNRFLQGAYALPGWLGATFLQATQGLLRVVVGAVELVPGIVLFPFPDTDLPEDFNVFRQGELLVDARNPLGENPDWLAYVLPATPFTIDARIAPISPWAVYDESASESASESAFESAFESAPEEVFGGSDDAAMEPAL
jgi:hypothetical protein